MSHETLRLLILGAHPDDAEYHAGGLAVLYRRLGHTVKMVSVTDGSAGHQTKQRDELAQIRRREASAAGAVIGAEYVTWDFPDGELMPTLEVREAVIREIRQFAPDLVLTHRTNDYHPDHRAVGQVVQDASYMVTVPSIVPDVLAIAQDPVVAYMPDLFTKPCPLEPDAVLDIGPLMDRIVDMLACHVSQVFQWLPHNEGILDEVPQEESARMAWLRTWFTRHVHPRADFFRQSLLECYGMERGQQIELAEAYEISEYAATPSPERIKLLFPSEVPA